MTIFPFLGRRTQKDKQTSETLANQKPEEWLRVVVVGREKKVNEETVVIFTDWLRVPIYERQVWSRWTRNGTDP